jgi:hypothetical protein
MAGSSVIGALRVNLGIDSAQFSKGLKKAETGLQKFGRMAKTGLVAGGAAVAAGAAAVGVAVNRTIDAADAMSKASQKFGIPIEELSRLKHAADLSGISFDGMGTGIRRLSQNMNDAKNGVGESTKIFDQLGISVTDADGKLKSTTAVLAEISDKFHAMPDGAEKTALAMDLMGRSGTDMIPLLNGGSEALEGMLAEADQFGQVFSADMGKSAEAFNDNITRLKGTFASLAAAITKDMLPHLEQFSQWLVDNAPQIREFATTAIQMFIDLARFIGKVGVALGDAVVFFQKLDDGLRQFGENVRGSVRQLATDIVNAFAALPGKMLEIGGQIIDGLWNGLKSKFAAVRDGLTGFASGLVGSVKNTLGIQSPSKVMHGIGQNIMQGLSNGISSGVGEVGSLVQSIGQTIQGTFSKMVDGLISGTLNIREAISGLLADLGKLFINHAFQALFSGGGGGGGGLFGSLFAGFFANGGRIPAGQYGIVGEAGPELVRGPADVTPVEMISTDDAGGSGGGAPNVDVHVRNVNTFDPADMLERALGTRAGEKVLLNFVNQNRGPMRGALGTA